MTVIRLRRVRPADYVEARDDLEMNRVPGERTVNIDSAAFRPGASAGNEFSATFAGVELLQAYR